MKLSVAEINQIIERMEIELSELKSLIPEEKQLVISCLKITLYEHL